MNNVLDFYGENLTNRDYVTNPAISREMELKRLIVILLTPEKSAILVGKPGIGKTAIVEGLAYAIKKGNVPDVLKDYSIIKINSNSLLGKITVDGKEELVANRLLRDLKNATKTILFIDEIHTLIGGSSDGPMDLANVLKAGLDRGDIKVVGATTTIEYDTYIMRDRAFLRRFEKIDVDEPNFDTTVKILIGSLPKIEKQMNIKFKYNEYINELLIKAIVEATSEYKRIYAMTAMYPDISFSILTQAFSLALFDNRSEVNVLDVYNAIRSSKKLYPDSIYKDLIKFRETFKGLCEEEHIILPIVTLEELNRDEIL